jgi:denticleless
MKSLSYIWEADRPDRAPLVLEGHSREVTSVVWAACDSLTLLSTSDDRTMKIWQPRRYFTQQRRW